MSRKLEEPKSDLNAQVLEVINSAIAEKVLPSIEIAIRPTKTTLNTKWDLRSDGRHQSELAQATQKHDLRPVEMHLSKISRQNGPRASESFPSLITTSSNRNNHCRAKSMNSVQSDEEGYDGRFLLLV